MTTSESKGRFFLQNESIRIDSHNESNRIYSNRELECSTWDQNQDPGDGTVDKRILSALDYGNLPMNLRKDWLD